MMHYNWVLAILAVLALHGADLASSPKAWADANTENGVTVTQRTITLRDGRRLAYTARAGFLPLVNDATGETTAHVYFTAYMVAPPKDGEPRPLTFVFPGGPGAAATLDKLGPRHVKVKDGRATIVDMNEPDLYFELGDHRHLVHVRRAACRCRPWTSADGSSGICRQHGTLRRREHCSHVY